MLDIGCGATKVIAEIAKRYKNINIIGVDFAKQEILLMYPGVLQLITRYNVQFTDAGVLVSKTLQLGQ